MASELFPVQIESTVAAGTPPFILASPTKSVNLNADYLDDRHGAFFLSVSGTVASGMVAQYNGSIWNQVKYAVSGLNDVSVVGAVSGQYMKYNGSVWTTGTATAGAGLTSINADSTAAQALVVGTAGTDFAIADATGAHAFNLPTASISNRGALSSADWVTFNAKLTSSLASGTMFVGNGAGVATARTPAGDVSVDASGTFSITTASSGVRGLLSGTDWVTFNNKLTNALFDSQIIVGNSANVAAPRTMGGDATINNVGNLTLATVAIAKGGTAATIRSDAINNLMPTQSTGGGVGTSGTFATSNGTGVAWVRHLGSGNTLSFHTASQFNLPSTGYAQFDLVIGGSTQGEYLSCVAFDAATQEYADRLVYFDEKYKGGDIEVTIGHTHNGAAASTGSVLIGAAFQAIASTTNLKNAKTYDYNQMNPTVATSGGMIKESVITFTAGADMDSIAANTAAILRFTRGAATGVLDNFTTDWQLVYFKIRELT